MSLETKRELVVAIGERYRAADRQSKKAILDLGEHPKAAIHEHLKTGHREVVVRDVETGVIVGTFLGYISGVPSLFSTDINSAFIFKNKEQAEAFITEFADELHNPQILDCP